VSERPGAGGVDPRHPSGERRDRLARIRRQAKHALRIARWEASPGAGGFDRRTLLAALLVLAAVAGVGAAVAMAGTPQDANVYRVGVSQDSPYYPAIEDDPSLKAVPPSTDAFVDGAVEVNLTRATAGNDTRPVASAYDTPKGRAAAAAVRSAVERYNERLMQAEAADGNGVAAFPVSVELRYVDRGGIVVGDETNGSPGDPAGGDDGETLFGSSGGRPSDIRPPFPFVSLVLAFAFVVPMNFVVQAYASSILGERTNRRGELTLIAPVSPATIVAGKTLPYFATMIGIAALTALALGGGVVSVGAVVPIALLFLAVALVAGLLARSHKELTFVLVSASVGITAYVFVPAVFTNVTPIAAISPLTMVVRDLEGTAVTAPLFLFSTVPMLFAAGVLFYLGGGLYREEDLFARKPIPEKVLDALAGPIRGARSVAGLTVLLLPFVLLAELLAVAVLFVLPLSLSLPVLLAFVATIEEVGKSIHVLAGFERGLFDRRLRVAGVVGAASGAGFFLTEKVVVVAQVVGLDRLDAGRAFQATAGTAPGGSASPVVLLAVLLAPLALHVLTAVLSAAGASRGRRPYALGLVGAVIVHTLYNLTVVVTLVR